MHNYGDCSFCGGEVKEERVELDNRYQGKLYIFQGVQPAFASNEGRNILRQGSPKKLSVGFRPKGHGKKPFRSLWVFSLRN